MKTAECGRIKNLYEQRGPWHRSVSGCRKKDARLVVAKDEAHAAVDVDVDSADHDVLVGVASRAWELEPDDLTCAVLALVAGLIHMSAFRAHSSGMQSKISMPAACASKQCRTSR